MSDETGRRRPSEDDNGHVLFLERLYTFSHREKPYQRILIVLMTLFLLSGFAGLFGGGILSNKIATGSEFDVEYQRRSEERRVGKERYKRSLVVYERITCSDAV